MANVPSDTSLSFSFQSLIHTAGLCFLKFVRMLTRIASSVPYARWTLSAHWRRFVPDAIVQPLPYHECGMDSYRPHKDILAIVWYGFCLNRVLVMHDTSVCSTFSPSTSYFSRLARTMQRLNYRLRIVYCVLTTLLLAKIYSIDSYWANAIKQ